LKVMLYELLSHDYKAGPNPHGVLKSEVLFEQVLYSQPAEIRYLYSILNTGRLPQNWVEGPNITTIKAMLLDLKGSYSNTHHLDAARLGRFLQKAISGIETAQAGRYVLRGEDGKTYLERSTRYWFPPLTVARRQYEQHIMMTVDWPPMKDWEGDPDEGSFGRGEDIL